MPRTTFQTFARRMRPALGVPALAASLSLGGVTEVARAEALALPWSPPSVAGGGVKWQAACPLCEPAGVRLVRLTAADAEAEGNRLAAWNAGQLARVDSLYLAGNFGSPGSGAADRGAHLMARLVTRNAYEALLRLASDSTTVYEASESDLVGTFSRFSDPSLFPVTRLVRARFGLGRVCLRYDTSGELDTLVNLGEKQVRVQVEENPLPGEEERVLCIHLPTGRDDVVQVLVAAHFSCAVQRVQSEGPPAPAVLHVLDDMQGFWVRKWGVHRPRALVYWVTPDAQSLTALPTVPLVGARLYVPNLVLSLPLLPDVGFEDLRELDLPQPIMTLDVLRGPAPLGWLRASPASGFAGWASHGPVPADVRQRFPDY